MKLKRRPFRPLLLVRVQKVTRLEAKRSKRLVLRSGMYAFRYMSSTETSR